MKLSVHIPPDANPDNTLELIAELSQNLESAFASPTELLEFLQERGIGSRTEIQANALSMGVLGRTEEGLQLSPAGAALATVRDDARYDLLHFLMYTGWSVRHPTEFLQSWAYREVCNQYWEMGTVELSGDYLDRQVAEIIELAQSSFAALNINDFDEISFSRKSLRGAHNWLEAVKPPVIQGKTFKRRTFCPPELVMMAIGYVLQNEENVTGIDILLTPEKRTRISKVCLLEPDALDRVLDWTIPIFSNLIAPGTTAGFYGRFVRLSRRPTMADIVR